PTAQSISGTAAKGKPIVSAIISIKDANGTSKSATTDASGKYNADVTGLNFPLLLKITDGTSIFFSIANASGTCNIHPFTDLVVRTYFKSSKNISDMKDAFDNNFASLGTLPQPETINTIKAVVTTLVSSILERQGIDPLKYDMFTTTFSADSTGFDKALEQTQIVSATDFGSAVIKDTYMNTVVSTLTPTANDTIAPSAPTDVSATGVSGTSIKLTWTASSGTDVAGYAIYRDGVKIAAVSYTTYIDIGLTAGTQYSYTIEAYDWAGNKSAKTTAVTATPLTEFAIAAGGSVIRDPGWAAYDGTNYLVEYGIKDSTAESSCPVLYAQFVSASGSIGTLVSLNVMCEEMGAIAFGNGTYFTTWTSTETSDWDVSYLRGMFISPSGAKSPVYSIASNVCRDNPSTRIAFDGKNFMVVWTAGSGDYRDIYGQLISTGGALVGSAISICTANYIQQFPNVVYGNGKYFVAWIDGRRHIDVSTYTAKQKYYPTDVYGQFVSTSGTLIGSSIEIDINDYASDNDPFLAFDSVNNKFFVTFDDELNYGTHTERDLYARLVDNSGNVSSRIVISNSPGNNHFGYSVFDGTKYFVTWIDGLGSHSPDLKSQAAFFDTSGNRLGNKVTLVVPKSSTENFVYAQPIFAGGKYYLNIMRGNIALLSDLGSFYVTTADIYGMFFTP
ncbi:MAG: fibronectin type III domain-containing protein, partial [Elusimicrobiota bacterium]